MFNNKWYDVFDFTPSKIDNEKLNYTIIRKVESEFVTPLDNMLDLIKRIKAKTGKEPESLKDIQDDDLDMIEVQIADNDQEDADQ